MCHHWSKMMGHGTLKEHSLYLEVQKIPLLNNCGTLAKSALTQNLT